MGGWFSRRKVRFLSRQFILEQLEERIVLDAAVPADAQGNTDQKDQSAQAAEAATAATPEAAAQAAAAPTQAAAQEAASTAQSDPLGKVYNQDLNVVLISNAIADVEAVSKAASPDAKVIVYDAQHDPLATIEQKLGDLVATSGQNIDHLAIVSHGESGVLKLGPTSFFTASSVEVNPTLWTALGTLLASDARIDLYGCNIGEGSEGIALVQAIAQASTHTVWASNDMTGNISGADWDLEVKTAESGLGSLLDPASIHADGLYLSSLPVVDSQTVTMNEDGTLTITVTGSDADDPHVSVVWFEVVSPVTHGTLTAVAGSLVKTSAGHYSEQFSYTPTHDYSGADSFQFVLKTASDPVWRGFQSPGWTVVSYSDNTKSVVLWDVNNDGNLDIVAGVYGAASRVALGNGQGGGWGFPTEIAFGSDTDHTTSIALAYQNGYLYLFQGRYDQEGRIFLVGSNGQVSSVVGTFGSGSEHTESIALGDVNGDGKLDIIQGNYGQPSKVYLGNGAAVFTQVSSSGLVSATTTSVALGYVNGDGYLDIIQGNGSGQPSKVYLNHGDGSFYDAFHLDSDDTRAIALAYVNGDGILDVVAGNYNQPTKVYLGNGDGTFGAPVWSSATNYPITCIALGDVNNDGKVDIVAGTNGNYADHGNSYVYLGNGDGTLTSGPLFGIDFYLQTVALGDVNNDGLLDVVDGDQNQLIRNPMNLGFSYTHVDASAAATVDITVTPVNDAPSVTSAAAASVPENISGTIYAATGTDPDTGDTLTWTLSGTDAGLFNINATTGAVSFKAAPDYENPADANHDNIYQITVTATDTGLLTASKDVAITVTNLNEPPVVTSLASASVPENTAGTFYTATGTDQDAGDSITWSLGGTDAALFGINATTGVVSFVTAPDFETPLDANHDNVYQVTVIGTDTGSLTASKDVAITVTNVNEPPSVTSLAATSVPEITTGTIYTAAGTDPDAGDTITWTLSGTDVGLFDINGATGAVSFITAPDFENPADANHDNIYQITVTATDTGLLTASKNVAITVTDVNEAPVLDDSGSPTLTAIAEDDGANTGNTIAAILATGAGGNPVTDVDAGAVEGMAVVRVDNAHGTWEYSTNGGATWTAFGAVSVSNATVLADNANTRIRFVPAADWNGAVDPGITFKAWDQIGGYANGQTGVDASTGGGTSPFSIASETAAITVTAVNDPPTVVVPGDRALNENTAIGINGIVVSDVDAAQGTGQVQVTLGVDHGVITLGNTAGIVFALGDANGTAHVTFTGLIADVNAALNTLQYAPNLNYFGADAVTVNVNDLGNTGPPGALHTMGKVNVTVIENAPTGRTPIYGPTGTGLFGEFPGPGITGPVDIGGAEGGSPLFFGPGLTGGGGPVHAGSGPETGEGLGGIGLPGPDFGSGYGPGGPGAGQGPGSSPIELTGLHNYAANVPAGMTLVFNLDDIHFTDLCTDCVLTATSQPQIPTGLAGYYEAIKAGKTLVFNLSNISCMDAICAVGG